MAPLLAVSAFTGKGWEAEAKPSWAHSAQRRVSGLTGSSVRATRRRDVAGIQILTVGHPSGHRSEDEPSTEFTVRAARLKEVGRQNKTLGRGQCYGTVG